MSRAQLLDHPGGGLRLAERRQRLSPLRAAVAACEAAIAQLTQERAALEARLAAAGLQTPAAHAELADLLRQQAELRRRLGAAEDEWLSASESLEAAARDG